MKECSNFAEKCKQVNFALSPVVDKARINWQCMYTLLLYMLIF